MENFEQLLIDTVQRKILKDVSKLTVVDIPYSDRLKVPVSFLNEVYKSLDLENIKKRLVENLENEMGDKIANKLITEYSNDIKQIMSNKELREDLRFYARDKIYVLPNKNMKEINNGESGLHQAD